jgi:SpoVK/Ycf46/Vps4 family AAA+-type ATPase
MRRFDVLIHLNLPDLDQRVQFLKKNCGDNKITEKQFLKLGEESDGRSLSDLVSIIRESIAAYFRQFLSTNQFKPIQVGDKTVFRPITKNQKKIGNSSKVISGPIPKGSLEAKMLTYDDIHTELGKRRPTVSQMDSIEMLKFADQNSAL